MKINHIHIENIASLKGHHDISFEDIFKQSSLFAITGETGSGKSTLLNAISLAIYGKNYKDSIIQNDLVTLGSAEGKVEVIYQIRNKTYQSSWYCRLKKKTGEDLKTPKYLRELFEIMPSGEKVPLNTPTEELLGLSFDQFCKTVILNQGEFSKFLLANFSDRKEILERFYNAEALSRLGHLAKKELDEVLIEIKENNNKIEGISSNQTENPQILKQKFLEGKELLKEKNLLKKAFENIASEVFDITSQRETKEHNHQRLEKTKTILEKTTQKYNEYSTNYNKIKELHQIQKNSFEIEVPKLQKVLSLDKEVLFLKKEETEAFGNLKKTGESIERIEFELKELEKNLSTLSKEKHSELVHPEASLEDLTKDLKSIRELKDLRLNREYLEKQKIQHQTLLTDYAEEGKKIANEINETQSFIRKNKNEDEIQKVLNELSLRFEECVDFDKQKENYKIFLKKNDHKIEILKKDILENEVREKETISLYSESEKKLALLHDSLELKELKKSIHLCYTESLKDGVCVVCQTTLPQKTLKSDPESLEVEELVKEIELERENLSKVRDEKQKISLKAQSLKDSLAEVEKEPNEILNRLETQFKEIIEKNLSKEEIKKEQELLSDLKGKIIVSQNEEKKLNHNLLLLRERYKKTKNETDELEKTLTELCEKNVALTKSLNTALFQKDINPQDFISYENEYSRIIDISQKISESTYKINNLQKRQEELQEEKDAQRIKSEAAQEKLKVIQNERQKLSSLENPAQIIEDITLNYKNSEKAFEEANASLKNLEIELKENEAIKRQTLEQINDINLMLEYTSKKLKESLRLYLEEGSSNEFFKDIVQKLSKDFSLEMPDINILKGTSHKLVSVIEEVSEEIAELQALISKNETLLEEYKKASHRKELLELEIKKLEGTQMRRELLYQLVGRDEFRNFVLSQIEKELIFQTNKELRQLCDGRYEIIQENKSNRILPEFFIIDKLRDGQTRKISTLSGGETFMVSLACALALAELSRGTAEIDSFFIDEGFGTLDEESLEDVIEMLQSIQGLGKQIGVISHVKKLTERIPVNIHLDKNHFGNSRVSLKYN